MAYSFEFNEFITVYHVYKSIWVPFVNEQVFGEVEFDNDHDPNAVKLIKYSKVVHTTDVCEGNETCAASWGFS